MKKMGWKEGQGLGKSDQGMVSPLVGKPTVAGVGVIVQEEVQNSPFQRATSPVLLLQNVVGPGEVDVDLQREITEECRKYGNVVACRIHEVTGVPAENAVRIFVQFANIMEAQSALEALNGRFFGGRSVRVASYSLPRFLNNDLTAL